MNPWKYGTFREYPPALPLVHVFGLDRDPTMRATVGEMLRRARRHGCACVMKNAGRPCAVARRRTSLGDVWRYATGRTRHEAARNLATEAHWSFLRPQECDPLKCPLGMI